MDLHQAIQAENEALVRSLIKDGVDIHELNEYGETPLQALVIKEYNFWDDKNFCRSGMRPKHALKEEQMQRLGKRIKEEHQHRARIVEMLIQAGADVNRKRPKEVIRNKKDVVNEVDLRHPCTILYDAVSTNNELVINLLLQNGADVDASEKHGNKTILYVAVLLFNGDINIVESLLERGADLNGIHHITRAVNEIINKDETLLNTAVREHGSWGCNGIELIKLLLKYGADANAKDNNGKTVLERYLLCYVDDGFGLLVDFQDRGLNSEVLKLLIPLTTTISLSPLHQACMLNDYNYVRELCKRSDVEIDATDTRCYKPLIYAVLIINGNAAKSQESKVKLLLSLGADMNYRLYSNCYYYGHSTAVAIKILNFLSYFHPVVMRTTTVTRLTNIHSIFLQHAAILTLLNPCKNEKTFPFYSDDITVAPHVSYYNYFNSVDPQRRTIIMTEWTRYLREIYLAKRYIVSDGISFFDLLVADSKKSSNYIKNKNIIDAFEMKLLESKFPIYHEWILHTHFGLALERRKLLDVAAIQLCRIFKFSDPSNEFFVMPLSYLSDQDLKVLLGIEEMSVDQIIGHEFVWDSSSDYPRILM